MWVDYTIYLTTGLVLLAGIALIVVVARKRARAGVVIALVVILVVGLVGTVLVRPERFRDPGQELLIVEVDGSYQTEEVSTRSACVSRFSVRSVRSRSSWATTSSLAIAWDRGPFTGCEAVGVIRDAAINLPDSVRTGEWMVCDYSTCFPLVREA